MMSIISKIKEIILSKGEKQTDKIGPNGKLVFTEEEYREFERSEYELFPKTLSRYKLAPAKCLYRITYVGFTDENYQQLLHAIDVGNFEGFAIPSIMDDHLYCYYYEDIHSQQYIIIVLEYYDFMILEEIQHIRKIDHFPTWKMMEVRP